MEENHNVKKEELWREMAYIKWTWINMHGVESEKTATMGTNETF